MIRCRKCKSRFLEKHLYERHLRDKHPTEHLSYVIQQEEEMLLQRFVILQLIFTFDTNGYTFRREELEANRLDEITSGGFIPPADEIDSINFDVNPPEYHFNYI